MSLLGLLNIKLSAETAQFNSAMDKAASKAVGNMKSLERAAKQYLPAISSALTLTAVSLEFKRILSDADEIAKLSQKLGIGTEALSAYKYQAKLTGIEFEGLVNGIARLTRNVSDASNGLATPRRAFDFLNISIEDTNGNLRKTDDILLDVADKFASMENGTKKAALAQELFGRSGLGLIPFLNEGREGLSRMREEAEKLGIVLDSKTAKNAEQFNDNMARLRASLTGVFINIAQQVLPVLVNYTDQMVSSAKETKKYKNEVESAQEEQSKLALALLKTIDAWESLALIGQGSGKLVALGLTTMGNVATLNFDKISESGKKTFNELEQAGYSYITRFKKRQENFLNPQKAIENSKAMIQSLEEEANAQEEINKIMQEGAKLKESLRNPLEKLADEQENLNKLIMAGAIDQETYNRAAEKAIATYDKQTEKIKKTNSTMRDLGATFSSSFENAIVSGEKFSVVLQGLEQDIIRILLRKQILDPLFGSLFGGSGGEAGILGSIFGSAQGNVFYGGRLSRFAQGGIIGSQTLFNMPGGKKGMAGENGPEAIIPLTRTAGGDLGVKADLGGRTVVNVYAPPGSTVSEERQNDGGMERIDIFIDKATAGNIRPGTATYNALKENFGLGQTLINR